MPFVDNCFAPAGMPLADRGFVPNEGSCCFRHAFLKVCFAPAGTTMLLRGLCPQRGTQDFLDCFFVED